MAHAFDMLVTAELLAQIVGGKYQCATSVLLFTQAKEIRRITELGLHLFLAVAEIVVGNDCDDDSGFVAASEFECLAVVVELPFVLPTRAVAALAFGGLIPMRQA